MMNKGLILLIVMVGMFTRTEAQIVIAINGFPQFDTSSFTVTEAGNDYPSATVQSNSNTTVSISNIHGNQNNFNYTVQAGLLYPAGTMDISVVRTSNGIKQGGGEAGGLIRDGLTPVILSTNPVYFFAGKGNRTNVNLQFGLQGLSVINPAGSLPYTVVFTVTGN